MARPDLEERSSEIASELSVWRSFVEHAGWKQLLAVAEGQINARMIPKPLQNLHEVLGQEFMKGEAAGIDLFRRIPEVQMETLTTEAERLEKEIESENLYEQHGMDSASPGGERRSNGWGGTSGAGQPDILDPERDPFGGGSAGS